MHDALLSPASQIRHLRPAHESQRSVHALHSQLPTRCQPRAGDDAVEPSPFHRGSEWGRISSLQLFRRLVKALPAGDRVCIVLDNFSAINHTNGERVLEHLGYMISRETHVVFSMLVTNAPPDTYYTLEISEHGGTVGRLADGTYRLTENERDPAFPEVNNSMAHHIRRAGSPLPLDF
ncbi:hypothetical protein B0H66DRAFT_596593 [Apodospora peruviana]|uniref:Uncharacterized protein n=1 Tax=Apodospora peruviana TaxID=516989 RepID=A0AAE0IPW1_9PEZI|nr:hypothetical protein B0H66DRAFT_596593 [Apodospora peruviana]